MECVKNVARVSYITSSRLVEVQSAPRPFPSGFNFSRFAYLDAKPTIVRLPKDSDIAQAISFSDTSLTTLTITHPDATLLSRLLVALPPMASLPLVVNIAIDNSELSRTLTLRSAAPYMLFSGTAHQAHDHALLAARLASAEKKVVLHIFLANSASDEGDVPDISEALIRSFMAASDRPGATLNEAHTVVNGMANGYANGHVNGYLPKANGHLKTDSLLGDLDDSPESDLYRAYSAAALSTLSLVRRTIKSSSYDGSSRAEVVAIALSAFPIQHPAVGSNGGALSISLLRPLPHIHLLNSIPRTAQRIIVPGPAYAPMKWTPLYIDVVTAVQKWPTPARPNVIAGPTQPHASWDCIVSGKPPGHHNVDDIAPPVPHVPAHESSYMSLLEHVFADRLKISNDPLLVPIKGEAATKPEFALGRVKAQIEQRDLLVNAVQTLLQSAKNLPNEVHVLLGKWLQVREDGAKSRQVGDAIITRLETVSGEDVQRVLSLKEHFALPSRWIIGSDAWSFDLGASGFHHLVSSGLNVNLLLLDTNPYSERAKADPTRRKKDAGLYAMNHGDVYVASIAVYSSYSQCLQALGEADAYPGPSVVLAYLPYTSESDPALKILRETKTAVDAGYWPLYRWNPAKDVKGQEPFSLDSEAIKADLRAFLDRHNHLSHLTRSTPALASELVTNLGQTLHDARIQKAEAMYDALLSAMQSSAPPLLVLYASDGGVAEKMAKRLANRGTGRGLHARVQTFDSFSIDALKDEGKKGVTVVFITSTAGQGEAPQNGRELLKALNSGAAKGKQPFADLNNDGDAPIGLKFAVFGLGDSKYWPRPEDKGYYNKPGRDVDTRLEQLGATRVVNLGLGDDQDADGPQTGYKAWELLLWQALGVSSVEVTEAEPEPITNENIKAASNYLRGTVAEGLTDTTTGALAPSDGQITKFHGIYEQDDRDVRDARKEAGLEPAYGFMIRVRMPGGVCQPGQWLAMDRIADERGNGTFKLTTRQTFQFHGVIKRHLKPSIQAINRALLDTIAACGDVNRNVLASSNPNLSHLHKQAHEFAKSISEHLLPHTTAYHEIWLDKKLVAGEAIKDFEPLYGEYYLPRKFKIAVAVPPNNDVDVFANDVGFIAIADKTGNLEGFNVCVGGGMGVTHSNKKTYPRISDVIGFCTPNQVKYVAEKIMLVQRDNGNRIDRKNARLKYTVDRMGVDNFTGEVEKLLGYKLAPARPYQFTENVDKFGWSKGFDGKHHFTMFIENGRVQDEPGKEFKTGLREIAQVHKGTFRLTANQHLILADIDEADVPVMKDLLAKYKLDNLSQSGLRLSSSACVAFPTCGLAMAESERYLPILIDKVEAILEENGLRHDSIVMRMTGCPNGCARPYLGEVAFVGKAPGSYLMLLGGGYYGQRLNKIYRENVTEREILAILRPMIKHYALERLPGERFGDFVIRTGYIAPTTSGKEWYDRMGGEGEHREISQDT